MGKSIAAMAQQVAQERRAAQGSVVTTDLDSALGGNTGVVFEQTWIGEVTDEDDLVLAVRDGSAGWEDSPWPLSDLYGWGRNLQNMFYPGANRRGTLTIRAVFVPDDSEGLVHDI